MKRGINKQSTRGTIIIDLANPTSANKAIEDGLVIRGEIFNVELFHAECYIQQCFNCQGFGHIARNCRGTLKCGRCAASEHETKTCPDSSQTGFDALTAKANMQHGTKDANYERKNRSGLKKQESTDPSGLQQNREALRSSNTQQQAPYHTSRTQACGLKSRERDTTPRR